MKFRLLFLWVLLGLGISGAFAQVTIFSENMGNLTSGTSTIAANVWQNSAPIAFSGNADVRGNTFSNGYTGASGQANVFITSTVGQNFIISGIDTSLYSEIALTFGHHKSTTASDGSELVVEVSSDGTNYTPLTYSRPTGSGTANWMLVSPSGSIPSTSNLRIRFRQTSTGPQFRIDDVTLTGTLFSGFISAQDGNWNQGPTWVGGVVPTSSDDVIIAHTVTISTPVVRNSGTTTTVNSVKQLVVNSTGTYNNNGTTLVNGILVTANGVYVNAGSSLQINGSLQINTNGFIDNGSPIYGPASTLIYNASGTYGRGYEWSALGVGTIGVTPGYPNNVQISTSTLNYNNGIPLAKAVAGNLTINSGASLYMDYGNGPSNGTLTIGGNLVNSGNLTLGNAVGDDLRINGDFTNNGNFNGNGRAIFFTKFSGTQKLTGNNNTLTIPYLVFDSAGSRTVQLAGNAPGIVISAPSGGSAISFGSASDVLDLNGRNFTIGSAGIANTVGGSGSFKGSSASNLSILGTGNIGTLNFLSGSQQLSTFTINRTAASIAATLGTPLTVSSALNLTSGIIDLGSNTLTLAAGVPAVGSANSYVIADMDSGGWLKRNITTGGNYDFPIGDNTASPNGSQYSPARITVAAGTYTGYALSVQVEDDKHPNMDANAHYLTRYWSVAKTGTSPAYTFQGTYTAADVVGAESNLLSNQWNGTTSSWQNGGMPSGSLTLSYPATTYPNINHFTAGWRNSDINILQNTTPYASGSTYDFGDILTGNTSDVTFTIQNLGQQSLAFSSATVSGATYSFNPAFSLTPGITGPTGNRTFTIRFAPVAGGTFTGSVTFVSNDPDESPYVINFTGVGIVPAPEINVRGIVGSNPTIFSGDATPSGTDNTQFTSLAIGASQTKSFRIENIGTLGLNVSSITFSGGNAGDFTLTASAPYTIPFTGTNYVDFSITFSPTAAGLRTTTVVVANNDATGGENPYTFVIEGNGTCGTATNTVQPVSGPEGTVVTITATANNLSGATVTFNGVAAVVTPVSATQIKVVVPAGATTGTLQTTNASGCTASNYFTVVDFSLASCQGNSGDSRSKLFISEVTDHASGHHSYVEIFNGTGSSVNLSGYKLIVYYNGGPTTSTIALPSYTLLSGGTYLVGFGQGDSTLNPGSGSPNFTSTINGINSNDHIRLYDNTNTWIDLWGDTSGADFTASPSGYTYRRKNTGITAPSTVWNPDDWTSLAPVNYTNIGQYDYSPGVLPSISVQPAFTPSCKTTALSVVAAEGFAGGNPLSYQWFGLAPNAANWTQLSNNALYSGVTSATLNISNIATLSGYQYYVQVREDSNTCYIASHAVMVTGAQTVTWNGTGWTPSAPTSGDFVVINGNYNTSVNGSFEACSVTINNGFILTIGANNYVLIENDLTINTTASLQVLDDGSLVMVQDSGIVTNNGNTQVVKTTSPYQKFDYTYWSSPVVNATIGGPFATWRTDYAFIFNTANYADVVAPFDGFDDNGNAWQNVTTATVMTPGKGYAIMAPTTGTFPATSTVTFQGKVNNGIVSIPLAMSGNAASTNDDFNLIGNPYPSAISADDFINTNADFAGTLYFWTHRTGISSSNPGPDTNNFITDDYAMYNLSGGTSSGTGSAVPTGYVASGQGFFVEAQAATNIVFNNSMRDKGYANSNFYRQNDATTTSRDRVWLNFENNYGLFSQQLIGYFAESTDDVDRGYDGIVNPAANTVSFYSFIGDDKYRIQGRKPFSEDDIVALGFSTAAAGTYTVRIGAVEGLLAASQTHIYLQDKLTGIIHDLKNSAFTFTTDAGTFDNRFILRYTTETLSVGEHGISDDVIAFAQGGTVTVKSSETVSEVSIFDLTGRLVYTRNGIDSKHVVLENVVRARQGLIVRILTASGKTFSKKIIN